MGEIAMYTSGFSRRFPSLTWGFCLLSVAFLFVSGVVSAADERSVSSDEATAKAKSLIENMLKERERITSGIVFVRGNQLIRGDELPDHPSRGMYAFDHPHGLLRFDNSKSMIVRSINPEK